MSIQNDMTDEDVATFELDGAFVLRAVVRPEEIASMREGIEIALADASAFFQDRVPKGAGGRFYNGFFHWMRNERFKRFLLESSLAEVAARFMRARRVNFLYDQLMVKEPGTAAETPWHRDSTYFPVSGGRLVSIWVPFDPVSPSNGVVTYLKGSHLWSDTDPRIATLPKPGEPLEHELLTWVLEPGDVLLHDVRTVHGARGNDSAARRRAVATRWVDQDARYTPVPQDFFSSLRKSHPGAPPVDVAEGQPFDSPMFPRVWPRTNS